MLNGDILGCFRCLETGSPLHMADAQLLNRINEMVHAGQLCNRLGQPLVEPLTEGLVNDEKTILYAVHNDIPQLIADESILLSQLDG